MKDNEKNVQLLLKEVNRLQYKYELSQTIDETYFEPGNMEYLDQYYGEYKEESGTILIRFDARGMRYEGRTEHLERINPGRKLQLVRDRENAYNSNNFRIMTENNIDLGNVPAELCNVIAPLYDANQLKIKSATVSFIDPITKRSRYAKQGVMFAEAVLELMR